MSRYSTFSWCFGTVSQHRYNSDKIVFVILCIALKDKCTGPACLEIFSKSLPAKNSSQSKKSVAEQNANMFDGKLMWKVAPTGTIYDMAKNNIQNKEIYVFIAGFHTYNEHAANQLVSHPIGSDTLCLHSWWIHLIKIVVAFWRPSV